MATKEERAAKKAADTKLRKSREEKIKKWFRGIPGKVKEADARQKARNEAASKKRKETARK